MLVGLICDQNIPSDNPTFGELTGNDCQYITTHTSSGVCPVSTLPTPSTFNFVSSYLVAPALIAFGFGLVLFGDRLFPFAVFLIGFSVSGFIITELLYISFLNDSTSALIIYTSIASLVLAAIMVGLLLIKLDRLGVALLSGSASFVVSILLDESWLYIYEMPTLFTYLLGLITISSCVLGFLWP